jgi:hypothetical protein
MEHDGATAAWQKRVWISAKPVPVTRRETVPSAILLLMNTFISHSGRQATTGLALGGHCLY